MTAIARGAEIKLPPARNVGANDQANAVDNFHHPARPVPKAGHRRIKPALLRSSRGSHVLLRHHESSGSYTRALFLSTLAIVVPSRALGQLIAIPSLETRRPARISAVFDAHLHAAAVRWPLPWL